MIMDKIFSNLNSSVKRLCFSVSPREIFDLVQRKIALLRCKSSAEIQAMPEKTQQNEAIMSSCSWSPSSWRAS
ncbi:hypothetical protein [Phreatobacter stygius]|uniref:Uncharacterized protein n=1 Tax=Phreatobacter stygius TaxID=1940610 RepID=A0A4D7BB18_9HYPH|nr:hypothetical protein [Phreatobacter stygius]QCI65302.1 hypothetical protein E8M01_14435 [Phreatobacter stygius]